MTATVLTATCVEVEDMGSYLIVGFADEQASDHFTLQRGYEDDDQDRRLGMDTYHIERGDQGRSCYGGITTLAVRANRVEIRFDAAGQKTMGGATDLRIDFSIDRDRFDALVAGLERVFASTDCLRVEG